MDALQKLRSKNKEQKFVCVGLDSDLDKIPFHLKSLNNPILEFNKRIIEATTDYAAAYKLNFAFYEKMGVEGIQILKDTVAIIPRDILIIGDAKRGDIGNTSLHYAQSVFDYFGCDAITVNPYMGYDSVKPFLDFKEKITFLLALTSNLGANDIEKLELKNGDLVYQRTIELIKKWNVNKNCGIVFGATQLKELQDNISMFDGLPVLLPGVGAQGGSFEDVVNQFKTSNRSDFLVNISRGIIYKDNTSEFDIAAREELIKLSNTASEIFSAS